MPRGLLLIMAILAAGGCACQAQPGVDPFLGRTTVLPPGTGSIPPRPCDPYYQPPALQPQPLQSQPLQSQPFQSQPIQSSPLQPQSGQPAGGVSPLQPMAPAQPGISPPSGYSAPRSTATGVSDRGMQTSGGGCWGAMPQQWCGPTMAAGAAPTTAPACADPCVDSPAVPTLASRGSIIQIPASARGTPGCDITDLPPAGSAAAPPAER
ncbi:MAG: hypothetical protein ABSF26_27990 [Thermoguttaceae bacterium]|jgi:hypothetical protein